MQPNKRAHQIHAVRNAAAMAFCLSLALPAASLAADAAQPGSNAGKASQVDRVVFQVSDADPKTWNQTLNNMRNAQRALGKDNVDMELVVYGYGISMLKMESAVGNRVDEAVANGVKIVACEETMRAQKLTKDDMLKSVGYVPAGVIELIKKQQQGYAYIRP
jgi:uncharacterized protein